MRAADIAYKRARKIQYYIVRVCDNEIAVLGYKALLYGISNGAAIAGWRIRILAVFNFNTQAFTISQPVFYAVGVVKNQRYEFFYSGITVHADSHFDHGVAIGQLVDV